MVLIEIGVSGFGGNTCKLDMFYIIIKVTDFTTRLMKTWQNKGNFPAPSCVDPIFSLPLAAGYRFTQFLPGN